MYPVYRDPGCPRDTYGVVGSKSFTRLEVGTDSSFRRRDRRSNGFGRRVLTQSFVYSYRKLVRGIKMEVYSESPGVVKGWGLQ